MAIDADSTPMNIGYEFDEGCLRVQLNCNLLSKLSSRFVADTPFICAGNDGASLTEGKLCYLDDFANQVITDYFVFEVGKPFHAQLNVQGHSALLSDSPFGQTPLLAESADFFLKQQRLEPNCRPWQVKRSSEFDACDGYNSSG